MPGIRLLVGLGNPGREYEATRHNAGFWWLDAVARLAHGEFRRESRYQGAVAKVTVNGSDLWLLKPETFMNLSGQAVKPLMEKNEVAQSELVLVYDELAFEWGQLRIKSKGSAAGHNGVQNVIDVLGTNEFPRVRLGVHPGHPLDSGKDYLLSPMSRRQTETLDELLGRAAEAVESIIAEGVEKSMTGFNRRAPGTNEEK